MKKILTIAIFTSIINLSTGIANEKSIAEKELETLSSNETIHTNQLEIKGLDGVYSMSYGGSITRNSQELNKSLHSAVAAKSNEERKMLITIESTRSNETKVADGFKAGVNSFVGTNENGPNKLNFYTQGRLTINGSDVEGFVKFGQGRSGSFNDWWFTARDLNSDGHKGSITLENGMVCKISDALSPSIIKISCDDLPKTENIS